MRPPTECWRTLYELLRERRHLPRLKTTANLLDGNIIQIVERQWLRLPLQVTKPKFDINVPAIAIPFVCWVFSNFYVQVGIDLIVGDLLRIEIALNLCPMH